MPTNRVIEHFDVIEQVRGGRCPTRIDVSLDSLLFQGAEEALGHSVIVTITAPTHARHHVVSLQEWSESDVSDSQRPRILAWASRSRWSLAATSMLKTRSTGRCTTRRTRRRATLWTWHISRISGRRTPFCMTSATFETASCISGKAKDAEEAAHVGVGRIEDRHRSDPRPQSWPENSQHCNHRQ
ncbi:hypothetical protein AWB71_04588 [Caballeronia peredens]|nr:hypothetical protein AWB71_04588 [Caballeronia peredens]